MSGRDAHLLLVALAGLHLGGLLLDELGDAHGGRRLGGQAGEEAAVVGRVLLLGQARPQVERPDQLALADERDDQGDAGGSQVAHGRRVQVELRDVDRPGRGLEVGEERIVRGDVDLGSGRDARARRSGGLRNSVESAAVVAPRRRDRRIDWMNVMAPFYASVVRDSLRSTDNVARERRSSADAMLPPAAIRAGQVGAADRGRAACVGLAAVCIGPRPFIARCLPRPDPDAEARRLEGPANGRCELVAQRPHLDLVAQPIGERSHRPIGIDTRARLNRRSTTPWTRRRSGWARAATTSVEAATGDRLALGDASERSLESQHDPDEHDRQNPGQDRVGQRPADDPVDVVQVIAQDGDADSDRDERQAQDVARVQQGEVRRVVGECEHDRHDQYRARGEEPFQLCSFTSLRPAEPNRHGRDGQCRATEKDRAKDRIEERGASDRNSGDSTPNGLSASPGSRGPGWNAKPTRESASAPRTIAAGNRQRRPGSRPSGK